ncbi:hypothetical protein K438DRAFT_1769758 [Mycena galopus ATCC 62051]|nr:hypothetical protein K438DRAFT_1769758 [Mycena galopus ATCC 62051]
MLFFRLAILGLSLGAVLAFPDPTAEEPQTPDLAGALEIFPLDFIDRAPFLSMLNESEIPVYNGSTPFTSHLLFNIILSPFMLPLWWMSPWTGTGIPTRNSDQYCWYPHNPDIAGIGVRLAVYIQSVIVVILSLTSRVRQRSPPDSLSGIYRIQVYTVLAFVIAGAAQRAMGQLSIFHETVVVHLSFVSISSAWIGVPAAAEESRERWLGPGLSEHPRLSYLVRLLHLDNTSGLRLSIQSFLRRGGDLGPDWWGMAFMIPVVVVVAHDINQHIETCFPDAGEPWSSRGDLNWLAKRLLILKWSMLVALCSLVALVVHRIFPLRLKVLEKWKVKQRLVQIGVVLFFAGWSWEVLTIEQSLRDLPYIHGAEEDQWGFGQILPLVLLLPLAEAISDVFLARAEETTSETTIERQHREACIQTACDVQLVYDRQAIRCGFHLTPYIGYIIPATLPASVYVVVTDANVAPLHLASLEHQLRIGGPNTRIIAYTTPVGATFKSRDVIGQIHDFLVESGCQADTVVISLGGGTVSDLGGFAAATFMNGIPFVQIPTTLAAMVHSGLATHATVNIGTVRDGNAVLSEPRYVFIDLAYLETLPPRELCSGMAEVIQTRCIFWRHEFNRTSPMQFDEHIIKSVGDQGRKLYTRSEQQVFFYSLIFEAISDRAALMSRARIERSTVARLFDVGHTVAQSLQDILGPRLLCGEFLALGLMFEHRLLLLRNRIVSQHFNQLKAHLQKWCLPVSLDDPRVAGLITSKFLGPDELLAAIIKTLQRRGLNDFEIVFLTEEEFVSSISPSDKMIRDMCLSRVQVKPALAAQRKVSTQVPTSRSELHHDLALTLLRRHVPFNKTHIVISGRLAEETQDFIDTVISLTGGTITRWNVRTLHITPPIEASRNSLLSPKGTQEIQVRSSSSSLCYLLAFCVLARPTHPRTRYTFISRDHPMKKSHVSPLIDALRENGSTITYSETSAGGYTLEVVPAFRRGGDFKLDPTTPGTPAAALLMCAPRALVEVRLRLVGTGPMSSQRWIDLTLKRMKALGVLATRQDSLTANGQLLNSYAIPRTWYRFSGGFTKIASDDVSLANCCFALSAISGTTCEIKSLLLEQPDADFIFDVLPKFGCRVSRNEMIRKRTVIIGPAVGTLRPPGDLDMLKMPKSFLLAVMLAAVSYDPQRPHASTRITGITKQKGQDRIRIAARELEKFGVHCKVLADGMEVHGIPIARLAHNVEVECNNDHRVTLAFSVLGALVPIVLDNKDCTERIFPTWWRTIKDDFGLQIGGVAPRANTVTTATPEPLSSIIITGKPFVRRVGGIAAAALLWEFIDATEELENPLGTAVFENFVRGNPRRQIIYVGEDAVQADTSAAETLRAYTSRQGHLVHVSDQHSPLQAPTSWLRDCTPSFQLMLSATSISEDNTELLAGSHEIRRFFKRIVHPAAPIDLSPNHPTYVLPLAQPDITPALLLLKSVSADAIELCVDVLEETPSSGEIPGLAYVAEQLCALRRYSTLPVIFSLRSISHGGKHPDADVDAAFERFAFAIRAGCEYIAVDPIWPRDRLQQLVRDAHASNTLIIASAHDPLGTLDWLGSGARDLYSACAAFGDIVRISSEARHAESNFELRAFLKAVPVQGSGVPLAAMTTGPYAQLSGVFNTVLTPVGLPGSEVATIAETQRMREVYNPTPTRPGKTFFLVQDQEISIQRASLEVAYSQQGLATTCSIIQDIAELPNIIPRPDFAGFCVDFPTDLEAPLALLDKEAPNVSRTQFTDLVIPEPGGALHGTNTLCLGIQALLLRRTIISTTSRALVLGTNASVIYALCELGVGAIYICQGDRLVQTGILNNLPAEWQARVTLLDDLEELPAEELPTAVSLVVVTVRASVSATSGSRSGMSVPKGMVCSAHNGCIVDLDPDSHFIRSATAAGCSWMTVSLDEVLFERGIRVAELTAGRSFARDGMLERLKEDYPMLLVN